ncbi:type II toxin-antitoxin system RelE family toxin [Streptomyces cellulosae]
MTDHLRISPRSRVRLPPAGRMRPPYADGRSLGGQAGPPAGTPCGTKDPYGFNTTALVSRPEARRLRVGDHRVICTIDDGELTVRGVHVGHRSTVHDT